MDDNAVMAVLKNSRKARKQTTCYPCQRRKVKCDRGLPCAVCVSRGHSFLCSYGRPAELSKTTSSLSLDPDDSSHSNGRQSPPDSTVQLSVLREQLNHLHQELCEARKRHKQCEEAEDQVRRLQARCKEYEDVHVSLRAGDWSALARINGLVKGDSDTSSIVTDGFENSCDTGLGDDRIFGPPRDTSQMTIISTNASTTHSSNRNSVSTTHIHEPRSCAVTMSEVQRIAHPAESMLSMQQPQRFFEQRGSMPNSTTVFGLPVAIDGANIPYQYQEISECSLQPTAPNSSNHSNLLHRTANSQVQRHQRIPSSTRSETGQENPTLHPSLAPGPSLKQTNQQKRNGQALQDRSCFENSNTILSDPMLEQTEMSSRVAWTQISLFPPMMFSQDMEFMERSYADYWARIVVEAQQSTLLAG